MYTNLVDKYEVRKLIKEKIGSDKLITLLEVKDKPEQINWDALPNQFVAKCNHDSGGVVICKDKKKFIVSSAEKKLNKSLSNNYYYPGREWPYKNIKPRIIIEEYMEDDSGGLNDFKIMCFNGEPKIIQVMSERDDGDFLISHFDLDWNKLNIPRKSIKEDTKVIKKPDTLNEMIEISKILSENIPFVRIDLYEVEGSVYFGECTFFPTSGFMDFKNIEDDELLGSWIRLSDNDEYFDTSITRELPKRWYD